MLDYGCASPTNMATPRARGFHVPAEWEEHAACLIGWTCRKGLWPEEGTLVQRVIMNVIRAICQYEKVLVVAREGGCCHSYLNCAVLVMYVIDKILLLAVGAVCK